MADNLRWVMEREGATSRILVYAHNAHIKNAPTEGGMWSVFERPGTVMGQRLRSMLGSDLVIFGTSSQKNTEGLPPASAEPGSLDAALARVGTASIPTRSPGGASYSCRSRLAGGAAAGAYELLIYDPAAQCCIRRARLHRHTHTGAQLVAGALKYYYIQAHSHLDRRLPNRLRLKYSCHHRRKKL